MSNLDKKIPSFERSTTPVSKYLTGDEKSSLGAELVAWVDEQVLTLIAFRAGSGYFSITSKAKLEYLSKLTIMEIYNLARREVNASIAK